MTNMQSSATDFEKSVIRRLKRIEDQLDSQTPAGTGGGGTAGIASPIFVPAIGGTWDFASDDAGWEQHERVYGGGPYGCGDGGGIIEFNQVGISWKNGDYDSPYAGAFGIFTVPDGVNHIKMIPVFQINADPGDVLHFFGELLGMDETGCETDTYAYGDATIERNLCNSAEVPQFVTVAQLESDTIAHEVIRVYAEMDDRIQADACIFMLGWQVYLSGPGVSGGGGIGPLWRLRRSNGLFISSGVDQFPDFDDLVYGDSSAIDHGTSISVLADAWKFTAPTDGYYRIKVSILVFFVVGGGAKPIATSFVYLNQSSSETFGLDWYYDDTVLTDARYAMLEGDAVFNLTAGDTLTPGVYQNSGATQSIANSDAFNVLEIQKLS